ncbi:uncharacterized protein LOC119979829 [Tripterygium wilfordii]|uniref:uncharacterized protein LOC119979829 n=1 Tax=Tripterygium wilfordii TaxID=458696 RepID=UPI0018F86422|nr:uncharacterized protein LOC119979829 [Tripterygium wilfordii]
MAYPLKKCVNTSSYPQPGSDNKNLRGSALPITSSPTVIGLESEGESEEDQDDDELHDTSSEHSFSLEVLPSGSSRALRSVSIPDLPGQTSLDLLGILEDPQPYLPTLFWLSQRCLLRPQGLVLVLISLPLEYPVVLMALLLRLHHTLGRTALSPSSWNTGSMFKGFVNNPMSLHVGDSPFFIEKLCSTISNVDKEFFNKLPKGEDFGLQMLLGGSQMCLHYIVDLKHQLFEAKAELEKSKTMQTEFEKIVQENPFLKRSLLKPTKRLRRPEASFPKPKTNCPELR